MKKLTFILAITALGLVACKKESKEIEADTITVLSDSLIENQRKSASTLTPEETQTQQQENLIEDAQKSPTTTLVLKENSFDFKDVKKGEIVHHKFEITNTGDNPLIISSVKPGCGCTVPEFTNEPILPGKKGFVNLKFDSSSFDGMQHKSADVYANVENMPIKLSFTANVVQ